MLHPTDEIRGRYVKAYLRQLEADVERVKQREDREPRSPLANRSVHVSSNKPKSLVDVVMKARVTVRVAD